MSDVWSDKHQNYYAASDWIDKPSLFAKSAITYFPESGHVLDLGAGQGQDSRYFAEHGYDVTSTDLEQTALQLSKDKLKPEVEDKVILRQLDLRELLPFANETFDVVYAHLSLHYFDTATTNQQFTEIYRILRPGGIFAFFVNSKNDPEYGTGSQLEEDYYQIVKQPKRYFTEESAQKFAHNFTVILVDNNGETYKDSAKGIHNLIRYIGRKD